jgi:hypothetical protein
MSKLKKNKKQNPYARKITVPFKVNADEMRAILSNAHTFTKGNVSEWVRYAAMNCKPAKGDLEK